MAADELLASVEKISRISKVTCPDCHGVLLEMKAEGVARFRCHTGHAYSIESLASAVFEGIDDAMWAAVRALDEGGSLLEQMARYVREREASGGAAARLTERASEAKRRGDQIRHLIAGEPPESV